LWIHVMPPYCVLHTTIITPYCAKHNTYFQKKLFSFQIYILSILSECDTISTSKER
jgi:hypothetical protein